MKNTLLLILLFFVYNYSFAKPIDEVTAKKVGLSFLQLKTQVNLENLSLNTLHLAYKETSKTVFGETENTTTYFYIFNIDNNKGFVIVSGDDIALPVLGYSTEHNFKSENLPTNIVNWFEGYKNEIRYGIDNNLKTSETNQQQWSNLINVPTTNINTALRGTPIVYPLVQTHWNQSPYYNDYCPYDYQYGEKAVTGCVATAMAQVMKYWNYPTNGAGFHSYSTPKGKYGTLTANFGATTYDWASMPNTVSSTNNAVATLMYHCGISVDMSYGVGATGGSSAYVISAKSPVINCSEYAFKTYFGYKNTLQGIQKK